MRGAYFYTIPKKKLLVYLSHIQQYRICVFIPWWTKAQSSLIVYVCVVSLRIIWVVCRMHWNWNTTSRLMPQIYTWIKISNIHTRSREKGWKHTPSPTPLPPSHFHIKPTYVMAITFVLLRENIHILHHIAQQTPNNWLFFTIFGTQTICTAQIKQHPAQTSAYGVFLVYVQVAGVEVVAQKWRWICYELHSPSETERHQTYADTERCGETSITKYLFENSELCVFCKEEVRKRQGVVGQGGGKNKSLNL